MSSFHPLHLIESWLRRPARGDVQVRMDLGVLLMRGEGWLLVVHVCWGCVGPTNVCS